MSIEEGIFTLLSTGGTSASDRVYPERIPEEPTLPLIVYNGISNAPQMTRDNDDSMDRQRWQLNCWGATVEECITLREEVRAIVGGYEGTVASQDIRYMFVESTYPGFDTGSEIYRWILDIIVWQNRG